MKKIAYLCGEYPRATDTFIQREVTALRAKGFHVDTISVRRPAVREQGTHEQEAERKGTYYLLPCSPFRLIETHLKLLFRSPGRYFSALKLALTVRSPGLRSFLYQLFYFAEAGLVVTYMRKRNLIHIHNHAPDACGYVAMIASELGNLTYSMTLHGYAIFSEPARWRLKEKIEKALFIICISRHGASQAMLWSGRNNWNKIHIIHCGVEFLNKEVKKHEGRGRNLLFVGRFDNVKGLPILLDAVSALVEHNPETHFHLVGDGPEKQDLESIITERNLNNNVTSYGYRSQEELKQLYKIADVFAMTSFFEGIPVVLMEAMSFGVSVVAPRITGIPELIEDGVCGLLTTPGDSVDLYESIEFLFNNPLKRNEFAIAGRKKVEKEFNLGTEVYRLTEIMQKYLN